MDDDEDGGSNESSIETDCPPAAVASPVDDTAMEEAVPADAAAQEQEMAVVLAVQPVDDAAIEADDAIEEAGSAEPAAEAAEPAAEVKMAQVLAVYTSPPAPSLGGSASLKRSDAEQGTGDREPGTEDAKVASEGPEGDGLDLKPPAEQDGSEAAKERPDAADEAEAEAKPPAAAEDEEAAAEAADPPADGADDDGSALTDFPACLPGNWNVGKPRREPTYRRSSDLSGWVEQLVPRKAADRHGVLRFDKYYLSSDGKRFRSLADAQGHAAGDGPPAGPEDDGDGTAATSVGTGATGTRSSARQRGRKRRSPRDLALAEERAASAGAGAGATPGSTPSAAAAPERRSSRKRMAGAAASTQEEDTPMSALTEDSHGSSESIVAVKTDSAVCTLIPLASGEFWCHACNSFPCIF